MIKNITPREQELEREVDALKVEAIEQAKTIVLLTEDLQYIAGIVEKGTGSTSKDDLQVRAVILGYVQTLEQENKALKTELEALKNQKPVGWADAGNLENIQDGHAYLYPGKETGFSVLVYLAAGAKEKE